MTSPEQTMQEEARLALDLYCINYPRALVSLENARRIASSLGLSARPQREEGAA